MFNVVVKPVITEKSIADAGKGKFTFSVLPGANKEVIKLAVEKLFDVTVLRVSTTVIKGRSRKTGVRRIEKVSRPWKKAIVALKPGQKIALFDVTG